LQLNADAGKGDTHLTLEIRNLSSSKDKLPYRLVLRHASVTKRGQWRWRATLV
jgi:hypothetical protein